MNRICVDREYFLRSRATSRFIYHYTSADAMLEIVKKGTLRFTDCLFLNDREEYKYTKELVASVLEERKDECDYLLFWLQRIDDSNKDFYFCAEKRRISILPSSYYVLSGTTEKDSLPMWNYYSQNGNYQGYSLRIDVDEISKALSDVKGELLYGSIIYEKEKQKEIVNQYVDGFLKKHDADLHRVLDDAERDDLEAEFDEFVQKIRLFFKREGFKHENEFRVVLLTPDDELVKSGDEKPIEKGFVTKKGVVTPYVEISFRDRPFIQEIKMSPTIEFEIAEMGLNKLIETRKFKKEIPITKSELNVRF